MGGVPDRPGGLVRILDGHGVPPGWPNSDQKLLYTACLTPLKVSEGLTVML